MEIDDGIIVAKSIAIQHALAEYRYDPEDLEDVIDRLFELAWHSGYWAAVREIGASIRD